MPKAQRELIVRIHKKGREHHKDKWETVGRRLIKMLCRHSRNGDSADLTQDQAEHLLRMLEDYEDMLAGFPKSKKRAAKRIEDENQRLKDEALQKFQNLKDQGLCTCDHCVQYGPNACKQIPESHGRLSRDETNKLFKSLTTQGA